VKLLRFLQEREFERVGGNETLKVDVRILAATNRDLAERVREGLSRGPVLPPQRHPPGDPLAAGARAGHPPPRGLLPQALRAGERQDLTGFSEEALQRLLGYAWPGNVRELEHAIERGVVLAPRASASRPSTSRPPSAPRRAGRATGDDTRPAVPGSTIADLERHAILETLKAVGGSTSKAARILGISPRKIARRVLRLAP
jgi:transcriptional regulator with GAF, ATPase, and Fis domain